MSAVRSCRLTPEYQFTSLTILDFYSEIPLPLTGWAGANHKACQQRDNIHVHITIRSIIIYV